MTRITSFITAAGVALVLVPAAWGAQAPDVVERTAALQQPDFWNYDQQTGAKIADTSPGVAPQDLPTLYTTEGIALAATPPDAFERAVSARGAGSTDHFNARGAGSTDYFNANDNRFRVTPVGESIEVAATGSGDELEWLQIGLGLAVGLLLAFGLVLGLRMMRIRPLAH
jgi:hypothetical protein